MGWTYLSINSHLYSTHTVRSAGSFAKVLDERTVGVGYCGGLVKNAANGNWVLEGGGVERDEAGAGVRECGGASKC